MVLTRDMRILEICADEQGKTRKEIADALGLRKHPDLIRQIETLREHGQLERGDGKARNGVVMYFYRTVGKFTD